VKQYVVTYIQEVTQGVQAANLEDAGAYAKKFAAHCKDMRVLTVYPATPPGLPMPPTP
jgi:hypothetical protein